MEEDTIHTHILICEEFDLSLAVTSFDEEISWVEALTFIAQNEINIAKEEDAKFD
mgnify:CR=1 FL=1